jgi:hypothetical protein
MVFASHQDDYKSSKESFVSGMTGSTVSHINLISLVALVCPPICSLHPFMLTTSRLQGLYCVTLGHPLAIPAAQVVSLPLRMACPRPPPPPLHNPFRGTPRRLVYCSVTSHRASLPPLSTI